MRSFIAILLLSIVTATALAQVVPSWWYTRNIFKPNSTPDDYAAINQGQLMNLARAAILEMNERLPAAVHPRLDSLNQLLLSWLNPEGGNLNRDDYQVVTVGQLKELGSEFFHALEEVRVELAPGWQAIGVPWHQNHPQDLAPLDEIVNIGQAKELFAQLDGDRHQQTLGLTVGGSIDWNGTTGTAANGGRFHFGLTWFDDSNGDGISDFEEIISGPPGGPEEPVNYAPSLQLFSPVYEIVALGN